jgi:hypothetical protein
MDAGRGKAPGSRKPPRRPRCLDQIGQGIAGSRKAIWILPGKPTRGASCHAADRSPTRPQGVAFW